MPKSFDERLRENIVEVFEQHNEPYNPHRFEQLRQRLEGFYARRISLWPLLRAAAVLLLILAGTQVLHHQRIYMQYPVSSNANSKGSAAVTRPHKNKQASPMNPKHTKQKTAYTGSLAATDLAEHTQHRALRNENKAPQRLRSRKSRLTHKPLLNALLNSKSEEDNKTQKTLLAYSEPLGQSGKSVQNRMSYEVGVNTNYSFTRNLMNSQLGYSAGVAAQYRFLKKFRISSGVYYSQQGLAYRTANSYLLHSANNLAQSLPDKEYTTQFQGLEIPLELSYRFKRLRIATGLSSIVYLHQEHTAHYQKLVAKHTQEELNSSTLTRDNVVYEAVKTHEKQTSGALQYADFAKLLTLSAGYAIPLEKGAITIEPFIKYPAGNLTSANINLGFSGVGLRYRF